MTTSKVLSKSPTGFKAKKSKNKSTFHIKDKAPRSTFVFRKPPKQLPSQEKLNKSKKIQIGTKPKSSTNLDSNKKDEPKKDVSKGALISARTGRKFTSKQTPMKPRKVKTLIKTSENELNQSGAESSSQNGIQTGEEEKVAKKKITKKAPSKVKREKLRAKNLIKNVEGPKKGAVYISHLPHGFYETMLRKFFMQFGAITRLTVARSKKTANPMGYAFIEFLHEDVAHIVSKTMNGHLMYNKILKCEFIPTDKIPHSKFRRSQLTSQNCPTTLNRRKSCKILTAKKSERGEEKRKLKVATKLHNKITQHFPTLTFDDSVTQIIKEGESKKEKEKNDKKLKQKPSTETELDQSVVKELDVLKKTIETKIKEQRKKLKK